LCPYGDDTNLNMPKPIKITAIGSGNVAWHLTQALKDIGCQINQVYSRNKDNGHSLAIHLECDSTHYMNELKMDSDLYLIMVSDDAISQVVADMPKFYDSQILAHTSGSVPSTILSKKSDHYGSFYPLQTFMKSQEVDISQVPFLVYGSSPSSLRFLRMTATQLSKKVSEINDVERLQYHLSAVFVNNFVNHLACISDQYLSKNNLDSKILEPLMKTTFDKILKGNTCQNQTGPARRDDKKLMQKHINLLSENPMWKNIYESISESISNSTKEQNESNQ
jgi:predicted short-subunit dehydrogenase-like oxidoreductase (DUF2520 family)